MAAGLEAGQVGEDRGGWLVGWDCSSAGPKECSKKECGESSKKVY